MGPRRKWNPETDCERGFTLIELMVVVIVLAILAATIIPKFTGVAQDAKVSQAQTQVATLKGQLEFYFLHCDRYPTSQEGLRALIEPPASSQGSWKGPYIEELILDPWGSDYQYRSPGSDGKRGYDLWSFGADRVEGGEEINADITSWKTRE